MTINMQLGLQRTGAFNRHTAQSTERKVTGDSEHKEANVLNLVRPRSSRRNIDIAAERAAWQEREARLREAEDERIARTNEEILNVMRSDNCEEFVRMTVDALKGDIAQIHEDRAMRAEIWAEREMLLLAQLQEEREREREEAAQNRVNSSECADTLEISDATRNLMQIGVRMDNISALGRTRAFLASEENMLSHAIGNDRTPFQIGDNVTLMLRSGHLNQNDYRNTQLRGLRTGMARIDAAMRNEVGRMYRDSQTSQNEFLARNRVANEGDGEVVLPEE